MGIRKDFFHPGEMKVILPFLSRQSQAVALAHYLSMLFKWYAIQMQGQTFRGHPLFRRHHHRVPIQGVCWSRPGDNPRNLV